MNLRLLGTERSTTNTDLVHALSSSSTTTDRDPEYDTWRRLSNVTLCCVSNCRPFTEMFTLSEFLFDSKIRKKAATNTFKYLDFFYFFFLLSYLSQHHLRLQCSGTSILGGNLREKSKSCGLQGFEQTVSITG